MHRDIRPSNLNLDEQNNVIIIDYETATPITPEKVPYHGGFICWPRRLLDKNDSYIPEATDDLYAAILVTLHLLFPLQFDSFRASNIKPGSVETMKLLRLWGNMEDSFVWGPFMKAAEGKDYDTLGKMGQVFRHMG